MSTFLLEIGTEELPADFAALALPQIEELVNRDLKEHRLNYGHICCTSTPRRIVVLVDQLAGFAENFEEVRKGPPAKQAFKDGSPTNAAIGFAKNLGIAVDSLEIRETAKGPFVFGSLTKKGGPAKDVLQKLIPSWIGGLQGRRFMRWGNGDRRFSRPVRWLVCMFDDQLIPVCIADSDPEVRAGQESRGHRLYADKVHIHSASEYFNCISTAGVHVERNLRKNLVVQLVEETASSINAKAFLPESLLNELTDLVESPSIVQGEIDNSYLNLPPEVLTTVMKVHQRYVALYKNDEINSALALNSQEILLPKFLCICNGLPTSKELVISGNERVLRARLADADFFIKSDLSISCHERCNQLDRVTFSKGLGSLKDRVRRLEWLAKLLNKKLGISQSVANFVIRAASLCKHDLVSQIVGEFPELQGIMAGKYLLAEGEPEEVALAVLEHYLPKGSSDSLPESEAGAVLALAERFELLFSIFAKGERPSGSSDPYALRRAGNGILQILWSKSWRIDLIDILKISIEYWNGLLPELQVNTSSLFNELSEFLRQRIISLLDEEGIDLDLVQAVAGITIPIDRILSDSFDAQLRAQLLASMRSSGELLKVQAVVTRASNLAEKGNLPLHILSASEVVKAGLFEKTSEQKLLEVLNQLETIVKKGTRKSYIELAEGLIQGSKVLEEFFDGKESVMVMTENDNVRINRLNLLGVLRNQAFVFADFNQIRT